MEHVSCLEAGNYLASWEFHYISTNQQVIYHVCKKEQQLEPSLTLPEALLHFSF